MKINLKNYCAIIYRYTVVYFEFTFDARIRGLSMDTYHGTNYLATFQLASN